MPLVPVGIGTAGVAVYDTSTGKVYTSEYYPDGLSGVNWQLFADSFGKAWQPIAEGLKNKLSGPAYAGQHPGYAEVSPYPPGAYVGASSQGAFGQIDTQTLMLVALVGLAAFMFMKK